MPYSLDICIIFKELSLNQGSYRKLDIKIKDFPRTFQHQIKFFQDHLFLIYRDSNRVSQNWECRKYGTLWNLIEYFH